MLKLAICFAAIAVPLQVSSATCTAERCASISREARCDRRTLGERMRGAADPVRVAGPARETNRYEVSVPKLGSLILTHELDGEIAG
jgi:cytochrome d ubiquinol oxidase subunit I